MKKLLIFNVLLFGLAGSVYAMSPSEYVDQCCDKEVKPAACSDFEKDNPNIKPFQRFCKTAKMQRLRSELEKKKAEVQERLRMLQKAQETVLIKPLGEYLDRCCVKDVKNEDKAACEASDKLHEKSVRICELRMRAGVR